MTALDALILQVRELPSLPAVAVELLSTMERDDLDIHVLAAKITLDQGLTARTLRVANSSFYGLSCQVGTIAQAITVLGLHSMRSLVGVCSIAACVPVVAAGFDLERFWRHAIGTAACARALARVLRQNQEQAFIAGLLVDLGALIMASRFPEQYTAMLAAHARDGGSLADAEREAFGFDHAMAGGALAAYWRFPLAIQQAIQQAAGGACAAEAGGIAHIIAAAEPAAYGLEVGLAVGPNLGPDAEPTAGPGADPQHAPDPVGEAPASWQTLGLSSDDCAAAWAEARQSYQALCQVLSA